jgi:hypothetical protein
MEDLGLVLDGSKANAFTIGNLGVYVVLSALQQNADFVQMRVQR